MPLKFYNATKQAHILYKKYINCKKNYNIYSCLCIATDIYLFILLKLDVQMCVTRKL